MVVFSDLRFDYRVFREASALHQAGHRISIITSVFSSDPLPEWSPFSLHTIPFQRSTSLRLSYPRFWYRAHRLLRRLRADIYYAHDLDALWPAARAARRFDTPLIYDSHELWLEQSALVQRPAIRAFWSQLEKRLIGQVTHTIAVSPSIARTLEQRYNLETVTVVRNLPLYRKPEPSDLIRQHLGLSPQRPIALYQGGFLLDNGLADQIEAATDLDGAALVLIGDGPCETALKDQVARAGLEDTVYFIPRVPFGELHAYTCSADLGLCLIKGAGQSFYYSMPNKLFEYMMAGLPVLASDFPEMRSVIQESGAGEVVDPADIAAIGQKMRTLLGDRPKRLEYRRAALAAAPHYCWERESTNLVELFANL